MVRGMYAFSGDPITFGHIDVIKRAAAVFDELVVGIGVNPDKKYMFSLEERTEMARRSLVNLPNVKVTSFEGTLVDYAKENGISVVVKGVRNTTDIEYEQLLDSVGKSQDPDFETLILFAKPELSHISSSAVKKIQKEHGLIHEYVPLYVKQCLEEKMAGQYIVGVTGEIGTGKSYVSEKFKELGKAKGIPVHNIELDYIGHQILGELTEPLYVEVRGKIAEEFGEGVRQADGFIDRKALGNIVFDNPEKLKKLNEIIHDPILLKLRRELRGKNGLILLNAALIAETGMSYLCNNNVVLVKADEQSKKRRLSERNLSPEQIDRRLASQYNAEEKHRKLLQELRKEGQGHLWTLDNSDNSDPEDLEDLFDAIVEELDIK